MDLSLVSWKVGACDRLGPTAGSDDPLLPIRRTESALTLGQLPGCPVSVTPAMKARRVFCLLSLWCSRSAQKHANWIGAFKLLFGSCEEAPLAGR